MSDVCKLSNNFFETYLNDNRKIIDESLVSLRFMKEIDDFLDINMISQREFAKDIKCSEAYVSQLMSGVKKFNVSFINKIEKIYDVKVDFKITPKKDSDFISKISDSYIEININMFGFVPTQDIFSSVNNPDEYYQVDSTSYQFEI